MTATVTRATRSSASSQLVGTFMPWRQTIGSVSRCGWVERASEKLISAMRAPRTEARPEFTSQSGSGLTTRCTSRPSCLTMLYIEGAYQAAVSAGCCWERSTPKMFWSGAVPPCLFTGQE